jgi:6-phosphofructokinase 1
MGHKAGWLALGAGISGGADVILTPEIPYSVKSISESILERSRNGKSFSIIAIAEGAMSKNYKDQLNCVEDKLKNAISKDVKKYAKTELADLERLHATNTMRLSVKLEELTGLESRVTILGHLQRGGTPSAADRLLATRLGTTCAEMIQKGQYGVMVAAKGDQAIPVPLADVAGKTKLVPLNHPWVESARKLGTCMGD